VNDYRRSQRLTPEEGFFSFGRFFLNEYQL